MVAGLAERLDDVVDRVWEAVARRVPTFVRFEHEAVRFEHEAAERSSRIRDAIRTGAHAFSDALLSGGNGADDAVRWAAYAFVSGCAGLAKQEVLAAVQATLDEGGEMVRSPVLRMPDSPAKALAVARIFEVLTRFERQASAVVVEGWRETEGREERHRKDSHCVVREILLGEWTFVERLSARARELGGSGSTRVALTMVLPAERMDAEAVREAMLALAEELPGAVLGPVLRRPESHSVMLVPLRRGGWSGLLERLRASVDGLGAVVLADLPDGLEAMRARYAASVEHLHLAYALRTCARVITIDYLLIIGALCRMPYDQRLQFVRNMFGPVLALPAERARLYLETLDALLETGGKIRPAAALLHTHENTVRYRINKIDTLTGHSAVEPRDRLGLELALLLVRAGRGLPALGDRRWREVQSETPQLGSATSRERIRQSDSSNIVGQPGTLRFGS